MHQDVRALLSQPHVLSDGSLDEVHIFYPDPWPKKRHHKRRLVSTPFLDVLLPKMKTGGQIYVRVASSLFGSLIGVWMLDFMCCFVLKKRSCGWRSSSVRSWFSAHFAVSLQFNLCLCCLAIAGNRLWRARDINERSFRGTPWTGDSGTWRIVVGVYWKATVAPSHTLRKQSPWRKHDLVFGFH